MQSLKIQHQEAINKRVPNVEHSKISIKHTIKALEYTAMTCSGDTKSRINNQIAEFYRQLKEL